MYIGRLYPIIVTLFALSLLPASSQGFNGVQGYSNEQLADQNKTHVLIFRFNPNSGILIQADNNQELTLISDVIKNNKKLIDNGTWKIWVESFCNSEATPEADRIKAKQYSNLLKSYLITNCGQKEHNFITKNHSGVYNCQSDLVVLSIGANYPYATHAELAKVDNTGVAGNGESGLGQFELQVMGFSDNASQYYFDIMERHGSGLKTMNSDSVRRNALLPQSQRGQAKSLFPETVIAPSETMSSSLAAPNVDTSNIITDIDRQGKKSKKAPRSKKINSDFVSGAMPATSMIALSKMSNSSKAPSVSTSAAPLPNVRAIRKSRDTKSDNPLEAYAQQQQIVAAQQAERENKLIAQAEKEMFVTIKRQEGEFSRQKQKEASLQMKNQRPPFSVFGFSINSLAAVTLLPNLEFQGYIGSRYQVNVGLLYNAWEPLQSMRLFTKMAIISPEFRVYIGGDKQFTGHYFGAFGLGGQYNFRLRSANAEQGNVIGGGVSYGYIWDLGSNFYIDLGVGCGYFSRRFDTYSYGSNGYKYYQGSQTKAQFSPAKLKVSFIFRLNNRAKK